MTRTATFDTNGEFVAWAPSDEYIDRALARGELVLNDNGHYVVVPQPIRALTGDEKRRIALAKERAKK